MTLIWCVLIAFVMVVIIYQLVHRAMIKRAIVIMQRQAQEATDQAVEGALNGHLKESHFPVSSEIVADVWGKGVLAFEYVLDFQRLTKEEQAWLTRENLATALHQVEAGVPLEVTDWWVYEERLHVDVAYLMNESTKEYVADLKKLK